jgi:hypothetical protein
MDFRASLGEKITGESWLMRNLWKIRSHRYENFVGSAKHPIKFQSSGIRSMINDSWRIQGIREQLEKASEDMNLRIFMASSSLNQHVRNQ